MAWIFGHHDSDMVDRAFLCQTKTDAGESGDADLVLSECSNRRSGPPFDGNYFKYYELVVRKEENDVFCGIMF